MCTLTRWESILNLMSNEGLQWKSASFPALQQSLVPSPWGISQALPLCLWVCCCLPSTKPASSCLKQLLPVVLPLPQLAFWGDEHGVLSTACKMLFFSPLLPKHPIPLYCQLPWQFLAPLCSRSPLKEMEILVSISSSALSFWEIY